MKLLGYSLPCEHRIRLNFEKFSISYSQWKSCFNKLWKLKEQGLIDEETFNDCERLATKYLL